MYPDFSGPPRALQKDTCAAKGSLTHQRVLFFPAGVRSGARAGKKENTRTWRRSEGGLAGRRWQGAAEATPRPAGRHVAHPSLPGDAPRRANSPGSATSFPSAPDTSSSARAASPLRADAQRNPEARQFRRGGYEAKGRRVPPLGCGSICTSRPGSGRVLLDPGSRFPHVRG